MKLFIVGRHISMLALAMICSSLFAREGEKYFTITGKLTEVKQGKVFLRMQPRGRFRIDSTRMVDGSFRFKGILDDDISYAMLVVQTPVTAEERALHPFAGTSARTFYVSGGDITVTGANIETAVFAGNKEMDELMARERLLQPVEKKAAVTGANYIRLDTCADFPGRADSLDFYRKESEQIGAAYRAAEISFLKTYTSSLVSMAVLREMTAVANPERAAEMDSLIALLTPELKNRPDMLEIRKRLKLHSTLTIGKPAIDFSIKDTSGTMVSLSSYRGKYVLIEFWASWCKPCRAETPYLMEAYDAYKSKGFDILGVSIDSDRAKWIKAIHDDKLPWTQVSELKGANSSIMATYGITGVPLNFLVDPQGNIVAINLRHGELAIKLASLIPKSSENKFVIQGKLNKVKQGKIYLMQEVSVAERFKNPNGYLSDSANIVNGVFSFSGSFKEDVIHVTLTLKLTDDMVQPQNHSGGYITRYVYISPGTTTLEGNTLDDLVFSGDKEVKAASVLHNRLKPVYDAMDEVFWKQIRFSNSASFPGKADSLLGCSKQTDSLNRLKKDIESAFVRQYPSAMLNLAIINNRISVADISTAQEIADLIAALAPELRNRPYLTEVTQRMKQLASLVVGNPATDFSMPDTVGNMIGLSAFRGKYVLVEVWASWCGPCRMQIPHLIKTYNRFKDKNFDILGVSIDGNKASWLKAIQEEKLPWAQVSDLKGGESSIISLYGITGIPFNLLLDTNGIIVAKDLTGKDLDQKLDSLLSPRGVQFDHSLSWQQIKEKAKAENKYIFIDGYASYCAPCIKMVKEVFSRKETGDFFNDRFICVKMQIDRNEKDDDYVKSWYNDAQELAVYVSSLPTFLYFSPEGKLVHRVFASGDTLQSILAKSADALDTSKQYYTLVDKYERSPSHEPETLKKLAVASAQIWEKTNADKYLQQYLATQSNWLTKDNIELLNRFAYSSKDPGFGIFLNHPDKVDAVLGKGTAWSRISDVILREEVIPLLSNAGGKKPNWDAILKVVTAKYPSQAQACIAAFKEQFK